MSPPLKKPRKRCSKALKDDHYPSLISLPDEIIINCLAYVPRSYDLNLSFVSKTLKTLIRSPELHSARSLLHKKSLYLSVGNYSVTDKTYWNYRWYIFRQIEKTEKNKVEYELVKNPISFPSHLFMYRSATAVVGLKIYHIGGYDKPSLELWILDTKSGEFTQGPNMKVARTYQCGVEAIDGKIYVIGGCEDKIQVEIFDPRLRSWKVGEIPKERWLERSFIWRSASLNGKIYVAETGSTAVYDPERRKKIGETEMPNNMVRFMCAVDDVLYAWYSRNGLMWLDVKGKVWRKVADGGCLERLDVELGCAVAAEYDGKLVIFWRKITKPLEAEVWCSMIVLKWVGEQIHGAVEWHGKLGLMPSYLNFDTCLAVSV